MKKHGGEQRNQPVLHEAMLEWKEADAGRELSVSEETLQHHTILWGFEGGGRLLINDIPVKPVRSAVCVLPPGTRIQRADMSRNKAVSRRLAFDLFRPAEWTEERRVYEKESSFPVHGLIPSISKRLYARLETLLVQGPAEDVTDWTAKLRKQQMLGEMLELLLLEHTMPIEPENQEAWLKRTVDYIRNHYADEIKVERLADIAGMHPTYYSRLFRQRMNKTPIEFLTQLRMNKAKELLLESEHSVREVARSVGYRDEFYFSRRFKESAGCPPTHYSRQSHPNVVSLSAPYTDHLFTLGVTPCAAQDDGLPAAGMRALELPRHAFQPWEISRETFLAVQPDLIVCKENVLNKAREHIPDIAPIIPIPWTKLDVFGHLKHIARLVDREPAAEAWLNGHEYRAKRAREQVARIAGGATLAVCELKGDGFRMYGERNVGHVFYRSLQLTPPDRIGAELKKHEAGTAFTWLYGGLDEIADFAADFLLIVISSAAERSKVMKLLQKHPAWQNHPAVLSGRVFFLEHERWIGYAPGAIDMQLEAAVKLFTDGPYPAIC